MRASQACIDLIKRFEGLKTTPYKAVKSEKYYSIGYGHYGPDVKPVQVITEKQAENLLIQDVATRAVQIEKALNAAEIEVNQNQFDALCSFAFNVGVEALLDSTLWQHLEKGDYAGAAAQFERWIYADGKKLKGLVLRRQAERRLFEAPAVGC